MSLSLVFLQVQRSFFHKCIVDFTMNLKNYRNIASDSLLVAQIASALSDRKVLLPSQFIASLLDESAEKEKKKQTKEKKQKTRNKITHHHHHHHHHYFVLLKYSRTSSRQRTNTAF